MGVEGYEIMMATFPTEDGASGAMDVLKDMAKDGTVDIVDAAVLTRDADGEVHVKQESVPSVQDPGPNAVRSSVESLDSSFHRA